MQNQAGAQRRMLEHQSAAVTPSYIKKKDQSYFKSFYADLKRRRSNSTPANRLTTKEASKNTFSADVLLGITIHWVGGGTPKVNRTF